MIMSFSWKKIKQEAIDIKVRRAITQVQGDNPNQDVAVKHPQWIKQAQSKNYDELKKSVTELIERKQAQAMARRKKNATY